MLDWRIYYDDGNTYTGDPYLAPAFGVLVIAQRDPQVGRRLAQGANFYVWEERGDGLQWWEADDFGLMDYLARPGPRKVLIGRMVPNRVWQEVFERAYHDPDLPPKTAWANQETRR